jgi:hypothetical protein
MRRDGFLGMRIMPGLRPYGLLPTIFCEHEKW